MEGQMNSSKVEKVKATSDERIYVSPRSQEGAKQVPGTCGRKPGSEVEHVDAINMSEQHVDKAENHKHDRRSTVEQFTKGPWTFEVFPDEWEDTYFVGPESEYLDDESMQYSLLEGGLVLASEEENEANAYLIAAAPELYEALKEVCQEFAHNHPSIEKGRAALAKARGQS